MGPTSHKQLFLPTTARKGKAAKAHMYHSQLAKELTIQQSTQGRQQRKVRTKPAKPAPPV